MAGIQKVFEFERQGSVAIVAPRGDSLGFVEQDINAEINAAEAQLSQPDVTGLVLDLGATNYFGSVMIGALAGMAQTVRERNGRVAVCQASDDMQGIFKVMNLDQLWSYHDTRKTAVKALRG